MSILTRIANSIKNRLFTRSSTSAQRTVRPWGYFGKYSSWEEVNSICTGYDNEAILKKVYLSILKVKNGEAVYERDSVLFSKIQYSWAMLACLLKAKSESVGKFHVIDFGGSLGSSYFQNRHFFSNTNQFTWSVVEQKHFVELGKRGIEHGALRFYNSIDDALTKEGPSHCLLISSSLQYLPDPELFLDEVIARKFPYVVLDRITTWSGESSFVAKQVVPDSIYHASYPAWFFSRSRLLKVFSGQYDLIEEWDSLGGEVEILNNPSTKIGDHKGFFFELKKEIS